MAARPVARAHLRLDASIHHGLVDVPAFEWDGLSARPPASLAGSRPWVDAALATIDRTLSPLQLTVRAAGRLVGVASFVLDRRGARPLVRLVGAPHNDLADLLTAPGYERAAAGAAVDALLAMAGAEGWDVQLEDLDPVGALASVERAGDGPSGLVWGPGLVAPVLDLRDPRAGPSARRLRRLDRSLERLRAEHRVEFGRRDDVALIEALGHFQRQRDARLRRLGRNLALPPAEFLDAAVHGLAPHGHCAFMEMCVDGAVVARDLYLLDGEVAMLWLRALDMDWLAHSCGHLLLRAAVRQFATEGYQELDLGRGGEPYKFSFGARVRRLRNASLSVDRH